MFECSRQPKGAYNIMAIDEDKEAYNHVVRILLDAAIDSPIDLLLRANNCTSIARLRHLIKKPGLHRLSEIFRLNDDQYEDLLAIKSYINLTYNNGHPDITTRTLGSFDTFFDNTFDAANPITYDERKANASRERPRRHEYGDEVGKICTDAHNQDTSMVAPPITILVASSRPLDHPRRYRQR